LTVSAIVVAAGQGKRMNAGVSKQFLTLSGKPILAHTLECFQSCNEIDEIVLVSGPGDTHVCENIVRSYTLTKVKAIVVGGKERQDSVAAGLKEAHGEWVLIHDGVRPFISHSLIRNIVAESHTKEAVVPGVPVKDTIKVADHDGAVISTPPRESLWAIQILSQGIMRILKLRHRKIWKLLRLC
jgi:2-C-methyl-D-erythritol 4-phosphate cytidylyltransferase